MPQPLKQLIAALCLCAVSNAADPWKNYSTDNTPGLSGNETQFIEAGADGRLWIGSMTGISYYKGGKFTALVDAAKENKPLRARAWDILELGPDRYWIGHGGGAILYDAGKIEHTLKGNTVAPLVSYQKGVIWTIGKNRGSEENVLYQTDGKEWTPVESFKNKRVVDMFRAASGAVWVIIDGNGIIEVQPAQGPGEARHHIEGVNVQSIAEDTQGRIWCGLWGGGVAVWDGKAWTRHLKKEKGAILSITVDPSGGVWVATSANGLWHYNGETWRHDLAEEGSVNLVATTSDGRIWVSSQTCGGLRYWKGKKWTESLPGPLPIRCLVEAPDKSLWAGGVLDGVHVLKK